jgi:hypothetical protein
MASKDMSLAALVDISHQSVCRCEVSTGAAQVALFRKFFEALEERAAQVVRSRHGPVFAVISYAGDATNSCIWQGAKLYATEVQAGYQFERGGIFHRREAFADCQRMIGESAVPFSMPLLSLCCRLLSPHRPSLPQHRRAAPQHNCHESLFL